MSQLKYKKKSLLNYLFLSFVVFFLFHLVYTFFATDIRLQLASGFIDVVLASLFLLAIFDFDYAFIASLLLLPVFFLLENISVINRVYHSQSLSGLSFYAVDPRVIGFSIAIFFAFLFLLKKRASFSTAPLSKIIPVVISFFCLSALWSVGQQEKYVQVSYYLLLAILYFVTYFSIKNKRSFYRLMTFLIALSLPAILLSYYQLFGGVFYEYADLEIKRVSGPFNSPNLLGSLLLVTSALALILLLIPKAISYLKYNRLLIT